jgi:uncharacterized damage-inducible protein DinB
MRGIALFVCIVLSLSAPALAEHHEGEDSMYTATLAANFEFVSGRLVQLAEAMPGDVYAWRPAEGVRSTSETIMHLANANLMLPMAMGVAPPEGMEMSEDMHAAGREREKNITAKADVIAELKDSIEYCKNAIGDFPAAMLDEEIELFGPPMSKRAVLLILLSHSHEHLGQLIAYARSNDVTPPWSEPGGGGH